MDITLPVEQNIARGKTQGTGRQEATTSRPRPYRCTYSNCEYSAGLKQTLEMHIGRKHSAGKTKTSQCPLCPAKFFGPCDLRRHISRHVNENRLKCDHCGFRGHTMDSLRTHTEGHYNGKLLPAPLRLSCSFPGCSYTNTGKNNLKSHSRTHEVDPLLRQPLVCTFPACDFRTTFPGGLQGHIRRRHNPDRLKEFSCSLCSKSFYEKSTLENHIKFLHTKEIIYECGKCLFRTYRCGDLRIHERRVHGEGPPVEKKFKCEKCDYRAFQIQQLDRHKRAKHSDGTELKCEHPGCKFLTHYSGTMNIHMLSHKDKVEAQFPFACTFPGCDFRRRIASEMVRHERNHSMCQSKFKCKSCPDRSYPDSKSLFFHRSFNHVRRPYKCSLCDYAVSDKQHLEKHVLRQHRSTEGGKHIPSTSRCGWYPKKRYNSTTAVLEQNFPTVWNSTRSTCKFKATDAEASLKHSVCHRFPLIALSRIQLVAL